MSDLHRRGLMRVLLLLILSIHSLFAYVWQHVLPDGSSIEYEFKQLKVTYLECSPLILEKLVRKNAAGEEWYSFVYEYDSEGSLVKETGFFTTTIEYDERGHPTKYSNPHIEETFEFDEQDRLVRRGSLIYAYDPQGQIIEESPYFIAQYDEERHLARLNEQEIIRGYDLNGNVVREGLVFNDQHQLIRANGIEYTYNESDLRTRKGETTFLHMGILEIGAMRDGRIVELQVIGLGPNAIEIEGKVYGAVTDSRGIICKLIDPDTGEIVRELKSDIFGRGITTSIPYAYRGKRFDPETGLIYFGRRYYDPTLQQFISPDPLGTVQDSNLYQFSLNNPNYYSDPTGEFAFAIPIVYWGATWAIPSLSAAATAFFYGATASAVVYSGYKIAEVMSKDDGTPKSNGAQNKQFEDAVKEIETQTGKPLSDKDRRRLHDHVSGQNYGYHEMVEEGYWLFHE